ncbi:hypothetical protein B0H19DRAFT_1231891 [Mycena capillaripes]|nr:hypothetical protein B0H19DRAFT_1231891 [Mycena capillaripes]
MSASVNAIVSAKENPAMLSHCKILLHLNCISDNAPRWYLSPRVRFSKTSWRKRLLRLPVKGAIALGDFGEEETNADLRVELRVGREKRRGWKSQALSSGSACRQNGQLEGYLAYRYLRSEYKPATCGVGCRLSSESHAASRTIRKGHHVIVRPSPSSASDLGRLRVSILARRNGRMPTPAARPALHSQASVHSFLPLGLGLAPILTSPACTAVFHTCTLASTHLVLRTRHLHPRPGLDRGTELEEEEGPTRDGNDTEQKRLDVGQDGARSVWRRKARDVRPGLQRDELAGIRKARRSERRATSNANATSAGVVSGGGDGDESG